MIDRLDDAAFDALLDPVWRFLAHRHPPAPSDVIFVFGSLDLAVPGHAAQLYRQGLAARVLVTGRLGPRSAPVFDRPEALVFREVLLGGGVPDAAIEVETEASNTLENVRFGMNVLRQTGAEPRSALLVAKPFVMRRCAATFAQQRPDVRTRCCPPDGPIGRFLDRSRAEFARRLLTELDRLDRYAATGDIAPQPISEAVRAAAAVIARIVA